MAGEQERPEFETATGKLVSRSIDEFVSQLAASATARGRLAGSVPSKLHLPACPARPARCRRPARAVAQTVSAQRQSIAAMRAQLDAFDQQLAIFERLLDPLVEWSATWARLEEAVGDFVRPGNSSDSGKTSGT